jgi:predicted dienelactone hydrolase
VVVAANHAGNTALDYLQGTDEPVARINVDRPRDITVVLDWLGSGVDAALPPTTDRVFVFGHSYGAFTTFAAGGVDLDVDYLAQHCLEDCDLYGDARVRASLENLGDARVVAIATQAPSIVETYRATALADLEIPTLMQSARLDITTPHREQAEPAWEQLDHPDDVWVEMPKGGHLSFISICDDLSADILALAQPNNKNDGCGPQFTPVGQTIPVLAAYVLAFARLHVLGEERFRAVLAGSPLDSAVTVTTHP